MSATLADVARAAQVSRQVVSSVLADGKHSGARFSAATRDKVLAAVDAVGYRRHRQAAQMRTGRQGVIALLGSSVNLVPSNTLDWMVEFASEREQIIAIERLQAKQDDWAPRLLHEHYADGVIVFETLSQQQRDKLNHLALPLVEVHSLHREGPGCIVFNIDGAVKQAVDRFRGFACQRLGFVAPNHSDHFSVNERYRALCRHARCKRLRKPVRCDLPAGDEQPSDVLPDVLGQCDALLLNNDNLAPAVYRAAARAGRRIGEDLHLVSFDNSIMSTTLEPHLPSFRIVAKQLADAAITLINAEIDQPGSTEAFIINYQLEHAE